MNKKYSRVDDLLSGLFFKIGEIARLGKNLEKDRKTKIVLAEIVLIAENGDAVYVIWDTVKTKKLLPNLIKSLEENQLIPVKDFIDKLAQSMPYGFCVKVVNKKSQDVPHE